MDAIVPGPNTITPEEKMQREYDRKRRDLMIGQTRAAVTRNELIEAYTILERIRYDHIGDTAFREKITRSKRGIEDALQDFLLDDDYWKRKIAEHNSLTPIQYAEEHHRLSQGGQSMVVTSTDAPVNLTYTKG